MEMPRSSRAKLTSASRCGGMEERASSLSAAFAVDDERGGEVTGAVVADAAGGAGGVERGVRESDGASQRIEVVTEGGVFVFEDFYDVGQGFDARTSRRGCR